MILSSGDDRECMSTDTKTVRTAPQMALDMVETGDGDPHRYGMDEKFSKKSRKVFLPNFFTMTLSVLRGQALSS